VDSNTLELINKWTSIIILLGLSSISCTQTLACTIFTVKYENEVYFGSNEDSGLNGTYITFVPPQGDLHGYVWFGYEGNDHPWDGARLGGMNDQGLCYDENWVPPKTIFANPEKTPFPPGSYYNYFYFLEQFELVKDIENYFSLHGTDYDYNVSLQAHWADATGDAAVASVGLDGQWIFTRNNETENYLISTNQNIAFPADSQPDVGSSRERYNISKEMLDTFIQEENISVISCKEVLNAVHFDGFTVYSHIFDLVNRDIYLYYYSDFDNALRMNLDDELEKGYQKHRITDLFDKSLNSTMSSSSISESSAFSSSSNLTSGFIGIILFLLMTFFVIKRSLDNQNRRNG